MLGGEMIVAKRESLVSLLSDYSRYFDVFISLLLIFLGFYIYSVGFQDVKMLTTIVSMILVIYGIKRIFDAIIRSQMGKEFEKLMEKKNEMRIPSNVFVCN